MKNIDKIKSLPTEDFAEYIQAVFLTGKYYGSKHNTLDKSEWIDYIKWLNTTADESYWEVEYIETK